MIKTILFFITYTGFVLFMIKNPDRIRKYIYCLFLLEFFLILYRILLRNLIEIQSTLFLVTYIGLTLFIIFIVQLYKFYRYYKINVKPSVFEKINEELEILKRRILTTEIEIFLFKKLNRNFRIFFKIFLSISWIGVIILLIVDGEILKISLYFLTIITIINRFLINVAYYSFLAKIFEIYSEFFKSDENYQKQFYDKLVLLINCFYDLSLMYNIFVVKQEQSEIIPTILAHEKLYIKFFEVLDRYVLYKKLKFFLKNQLKINSIIFLVFLITTKANQIVIFDFFIFLTVISFVFYFLKYPLFYRLFEKYIITVTHNIPMKMLAFQSEFNRRIIRISLEPLEQNHFLKTLKNSNLDLYLYVCKYFPEITADNNNLLNQRNFFWFCFIETVITIFIVFIFLIIIFLITIALFNFWWPYIVCIAEINNSLILVDQEDYHLLDL